MLFTLFTLMGEGAGSTTYVFAFGVDVGSSSYNSDRSSGSAYCGSVDGDLSAGSRVYALETEE